MKCRTSTEEYTAKLTDSISWIVKQFLSANCNFLDFRCENEQAYCGVNGTGIGNSMVPYESFPCLPLDTMYSKPPIFPGSPSLKRNPRVLITAITSSISELLIKLYGSNGNGRKSLKSLKLWPFWHIQLAGGEWLPGETPLVLDTDRGFSSTSLALPPGEEHAKHTKGKLAFIWGTKSRGMKKCNQSIWWLLIQLIRNWVCDYRKTEKDLKRVVPGWIPASWRTVSLT